MTVKATSALSILAIWVTSILAVAVESDSWWILIFALLATGAVGLSAWRRLGISRLVAISGIWAGVCVAAASSGDAAWVSIFAFLSTAAVVYSTMKREAWVLGVGIAVPWLVTGVVTAAAGPGASWMCVFAFLTSGGVANSHNEVRRGVASIAWWGAAGLIVIAFGAGWAWLSVIAFLLTTAAIGFGDFSFPRSLEWDLWDRDDDGDRVKVVQ